MGHVLKTIPMVNKNREVFPYEIEIRSSLKDMRLMAVDAVIWTGKPGRFATDTGRGLTIANAEAETGVTCFRAGKRVNILADLDPEVLSGKDELICRICFQGVNGGVYCPMKGGNVCYQHCEKCRYGHWTGGYYSCRYRYKKGPALW